LIFCELIFAPARLRRAGAFFCPIFSAIPLCGMADFECNFNVFWRVKDFQFFLFSNLWYNENGNKPKSAFITT